MMWVLLFVGIGVTAIVLHGALGVWLWRRASALLGELDRANEAMEHVLVSQSAETAEGSRSGSEDGRPNVPAG